jgi:hypothetical protein
VARVGHFKEQIQMMKLSVAVAAVLAVVTAVFAPSLTARAQSGARFEYARVTPYQAVTRTPGHVEYKWAGYRACVAASSEWTCREFDALPTTLATLGSEGWELVSAVDGRHELNGGFGGLTYLFKRPRQ